MRATEKLKNQYCINLDDATAQQVEKIAEYYQRKPAELLRLLLAPVLRNEWATIQREQHPENQLAPTVARFHN